jgi:hypothetical protein
LAGDNSTLLGVPGSSGENGLEFCVPGVTQPVLASSPHVITISESRRTRMGILS